MDSELREWIRTRPPEVQAAMCRFPPDSTVRTVEGVHVSYPSPGTTLPVVSWFGNGNVGVQSGTVRAQCEPDWLEVAEYGEITPAMVEEAIGVVEVKLPGPGERYLWWPLARRMSEPTRRRLWAIAFPLRRRRWPWEHAARWLVTHTPWWGGPGIAWDELKVTGGRDA